MTHSICVSSGVASTSSSVVLPAAAANGPAVAAAAVSGRPQSLQHQSQQQQQGAAQQQSVLNDFVCGGVAAAIETVLTYPMHKLIFRQQLHGIYLTQAFGQVSSEGVRYLYRGVLPPLMQKCSCRSIMFGTYEQYQRLYGCGHGAGFMLCHGAAAACAGATEALLCPLERIQTLLQSARYNHQFRNTVGAARHVWLFGVREYYRGVSAVLVRNSLSNVLFFGLRDPIRRLMAGDRDRPAKRYAGAFVSGAVLGALISTAFYPANVVKTRMQSALGGRHASAWQVVRLLLAERGGVAGMFRGVHLNFTRSLTTWGITNLLYDLLKRWTQSAEDEDVS